jgi:hypothetical protein
MKSCFDLDQNMTHPESNLSWVSLLLRPVWTLIHAENANLCLLISENQRSSASSLDLGLIMFLTQEKFYFDYNGNMPVRLCQVDKKHQSGTTENTTLIGT